MTEVILLEYTLLQDNLTVPGRLTWDLEAMQSYTEDTCTAPTPNNIVGLVFPDWDSAIPGGGLSWREAC
jgi:hypothetical protein